MLTNNRFLSILRGEKSQYFRIGNIKRKRRLGGKKVADGFFKSVYEQVKQIPEGKVATYGQIARLCGNARMSRQVGWALHVNPEPYVTPCHRVVTKEGNLSRAFAFGGENVQKELLEKEGVTFLENGAVDIKKHLWEK